MRILLVAVFCLPLATAGDNHPAKTLTADERQAAYNVSVQRISGFLKAPATAQFTPVQEAVFSTGKGDTIDVRLNVDAQNSFGAMLRKGWYCRVGPQQANGLYRVGCVEGVTPTPRDFVIGLSPTEAMVTTAPEVPARRGEPTPPYVAPPSPRQSDRSALMIVTVTSVPSDALVEVDRYPAGRTPVDVKLSPGEYTLKISKQGFHSYTQKVSVEAGKAQSVEIALTAQVEQ